MSSDRLKQMKKKSKLRRQLLAQQLGAKDENDFGSILGKKEEVKTVSTPTINSNNDDAPSSSSSGKECTLPGKWIKCSLSVLTVASACEFSRIYSILRKLLFWKLLFSSIIAQ